VVRGRVLASPGLEPIGGARVFLLDASTDDHGTALTRATTTDGDGRFSIVGPSNLASRDRLGRPSSRRVLVHAAASGFLPSAGGLDAAAGAVDLGGALIEGDAFVVEGEATTVVLSRSAVSERGRTLSGTVAAAADVRRRAVVLVRDDALAARADADGVFVLFDAPDTVVTAHGLAAGAALSSIEIEAGGEDVDGLVVRVLADSVATVAVTVTGGGEGPTTVALVPAALDGPLPPPLVPAGLSATTTSGAATFASVPPDTYVVRASLETDGLVPRPDVEVRVAVPDESAAAVELVEAIAIVAPSVSTTDDADRSAIALADPVPALTFDDPLGADRYVFVVEDATGAVVWDGVRVDATPGELAAGGRIDVAFDGPPLERGRLFRFRVESSLDGVPHSRSEDLAGVFFVAP
jgi:hypothetical protein